MIGRACLDFEIGMDRSLNVNNVETHSVDEPLPSETGLEDSRMILILQPC